MFTRAIARTPSLSVVNGLTEANLGQPDFQNALVQHSEYVDTLKN